MGAVRIASDAQGGHAEHPRSAEGCIHCSKIRRYEEIENLFTTLRRIYEVMGRFT
jgi:hypothetical protein